MRKGTQLTLFPSVKRLREAEVTPAGWEDVVQKFKATGAAENPWALANYLKNKGVDPADVLKTSEADGDAFTKRVMDLWGEFKRDPSYDDLMKTESTVSDVSAGKNPAHPGDYEANSQSHMGQLNRPKAKEAGAGKVRFLARFLEGAGNESTREVPVVIIKEGLGNRRDKHFYTREAIVSGCEKFEGAQCYADHPTRMEEAQRPERSVRDLIGYFTGVHPYNHDGRMEMRGNLKVIDGPSHDWAWNLVKEAAAYAKAYPDKTLAGISVNAEGQVRAEQTPKDGLINMVDGFREAFSADVVTKPGAGGDLTLREAVGACREAADAGERTSLGRAAVTLAAKSLTDLYTRMKESGEDDKYGKALTDVVDQLTALADYSKEDDMGPKMVGKTESGAEVYQVGERYYTKNAEGAETDMSEADVTAFKKKQEAEASPPNPAAKDVMPPGTGESAEGEARLKMAAEGEDEGEKKARESYMAESQKLSPLSRGFVESLVRRVLEARRDRRIRESLDFLEVKIREARIPKGWDEELRVTCAGMDRATITRMVEATKQKVMGMVGLVHGSDALGLGTKIMEDTARATGKANLDRLREAGVPVRSR